MPVICIGNLTIGGAGKTPTALAVAQMLAAAGERPAFLSRGYGGHEAGPLRVDPGRHRAHDVGDEPLLLARMAPTIVARARPEGARMAAELGASVTVMDDGFQNPSLLKDLSLLVVDTDRGIGNGRTIPAGPLRAPLPVQLRHAHALVLLGPQSAPGTGPEEVTAQARRRGLPVFTAQLRPDPGMLAKLGNSRVLAFAGIGHPEKFFATLAQAAISVAATRSFPDHHSYTAGEAQALCEEADRNALEMVTTEKDLARVTGDVRAAQLAARAHALPVRLTFDQPEHVLSFVLSRLAESRGRTADG
jgi:tetraacyldisaccharide 4'-kinase